jgi:surfactin synthase thioesterase subunit
LLVVTGDRDVYSWTELAPWGECTSEQTQWLVVSGDHFHIDRPAELATAIRAQVGLSTHRPAGNGER